MSKFLAAFGAVAFAIGCLKGRIAEALANQLHSNATKVALSLPISSGPQAGVTIDTS